MKEEGAKNLFSDFPGISTEAWEEKIRADLKGGNTREKLVWNTDEGMEVKPYYRREDLSSLEYLEELHALRSKGNVPNAWMVCQDVFLGGKTVDTNERIGAAIRGGARAVRIRITDTTPITGDKLMELLDGIPLGETELLFRGNLGADALHGHLVELAGSRNINPAELRGSLGADPIGKMAESGIPIASLENIGRLVSHVRTTTPGMRVIDVNGALIQNAGSTLVEEVAFCLSMASDYLSILTEAGIDPMEAHEALHISLASGPNYFMEIAKLRAFRILWVKMSEAYGIEHSRAITRIHATSSEWNFTLYDPYVNMLRGTTGAMASILGGADLVSVLPFDYAYGKSSAFADRIARNIQIILREEAYFDRVADPAAGSYYIENLTDSIAERSWDLFRQVESRGGFRKAFDSGWIQEKVFLSRNRKLERAAAGKTKILGANAYPDFNEMILECLGTNSGETTGDGSIQPLQPFRISARFEEVRLETEQSGKKPRVLLFKFGNPAWAASRAAFAGNFFSCAGYEILHQPLFETVEQGIALAAESGPDIIVLCSGDDSYNELVPDILKSYRKKVLIVIAGYPADSMESLRKAGIRYFIHMNSNLPETLKGFNRLLL